MTTAASSAQIKVAEETGQPVDEAVMASAHG